ncbi:unnamed protein product [Caenorhabditis auriculariae]|uniref:ZMIZ1 N-terminal domain-containing protein n=1 Tax=Caenorhabditis auriculariae TaxID=2777116 RepID=A0A8S1HBF0_9PELO|nr:unnamed protein product [Caenorhabditis auriculariae]
MKLPRADRRGTFPEEIPEKKPSSGRNSSPAGEKTCGTTSWQTRFSETSGRKATDFRCPMGDDEVSYEQHVQRNNQRLASIRQSLTDPLTFASSCVELTKWCSDPRAFTAAFEDNLIAALQIAMENGVKENFDFNLAHQLISACFSHRKLLSKPSANRINRWYEQLRRLKKSGGRKKKRPTASDANAVGGVVDPATSSSESVQPFVGEACSVERRRPIHLWRERRRHRGGWCSHAMRSFRRLSDSRRLSAQRPKFRGKSVWTLTPRRMPRSLVVVVVAAKNLAEPPSKELPNLMATLTLTLTRVFFFAILPSDVDVVDLAKISSCINISSLAFSRLAPLHTSLRVPPLSLQPFGVLRI